MSASLLSPLLAVSGLEYAFEQSLFPGKIILWTLLILSLLSWVVILSKVFFFYRSRAADAEFTRMLRGSRQPMQLFERKYADDHSLKSIIYEKGAREVAFQMLGSPERDDTFGARLRSCGGLATHQLEAVREAFRRGEEAAAARLRKGMPLLSAAGTGAPFLGLLGMVWILMKTFSQAGAETSALSSVAPGVSGALAMMVVALLVSTPAIFALVVLSTANREKTRQMGDFRAEAVRLIERFYSGTGSSTVQSLPENSPAANIAAAAAAAAMEAKEEAVEDENFFEDEEIEEEEKIFIPEPAIVDEDRMAEPEEAIVAEDQMAEPEEAVESTPAALETPPPLEEAVEELLEEEVEELLEEEMEEEEPAPAAPATPANEDPVPSEPAHEEPAAPAPEETAVASEHEPEPVLVPRKRHDREDSFLLPRDQEELQTMPTGPVYADVDGEESVPSSRIERQAEQLELRPLRVRPREKPVEDEYETPFAEPELSPIAQQTAVLMARRRRPEASE